jgi:hypothetical protein
MASLCESGMGSRRRERRHKKLQRLAPRPIVAVEKIAVAIAAVSVDLALLGFACVPVAIFWGGWDAVWREPLAIGGLLVYGLPISALGAYWYTLRSRGDTVPSPFRCFRRAFAGAGIGMAIGAGAAAVFAGLLLAISANGA